MLLIQNVVEIPDACSEIPRRHLVLVIENTATQDIEQHICIMMSGHVLFIDHLEAIAGCHDPRQTFRSCIDRGFDILGDIIGCGQTLAETEYFGL